MEKTIIIRITNPTKAQDALLQRLVRAFRAEHIEVQENTAFTLLSGNLQIDPQRRLVWQSDQTVDLTPMEFDILLLLARRPGQVFSAHQIYEAVATDSFDAGWTGISSMVYKLRRKLGADIIEIVRGHGYNSRRLSGNPVQNRTSAENPALQAAGGRLDLSQNGSASLGLSRRLHSRFAANRCPKNPFLPPISREWTRMGNR